MGLSVDKREFKSVMPESKGVSVRFEENMSGWVDSGKNKGLSEFGPEVGLCVNEECLSGSDV